jgi:hypothetical protein
MIYDFLLLLIEKYKALYKWFQKPRQQIAEGTVIMLLALAFFGSYPLFK